MTTRRMPITFARYARNAYKRHKVECSLEEFMAWLEGWRAGKTVTCVYCGQFVSEVEWHLEHWQPRASGGPSTLANLMISCKDCNLMKDTLPPVLFNRLVGVAEQYKREDPRGGAEFFARLRASAGWRKRRAEIRTPKVRWK